MVIPLNAQEQAYKDRSGALKRDLAKQQAKAAEGINMRGSHSWAGSEWDVAQQEAKRIQREISALETTDAAATAILKEELVAEIKKKLQGVDPETLLDFAGDVTRALLDGPESEKFSALVRDLVLHGYAFFQHPDLVAASAKSKHLRYEALLRASLPADFAQKLMIAEAARPFPQISWGGKK